MATEPKLIYNNDDSLKATAVTVTSSYSGKLQASNYGANVVTIDASSRTKAINITGNAKNNKIFGGSGNDTLAGGTGKNTLTGGEGNDVFIYSGGSAVITDYGTGNDTIKIDTNSVDFTSVETVSSNIVVKTSGGNVTLKGGKGKDINLVDASGKSLVVINELENNGTAKADTISNAKDKATINALAGNDSINNIGKNVSINGGAGTDKITVGSGSDKVTIMGGAGNDTIYNSAKNNLYQYASGDGNDVIVGYNESDTLHITSGDYSHSISGNDFVVKVGSNTIKLKDAANKTITLKNSANKIEKVTPKVVEPLPEGWKYGTSSATSSTTTIITATVGTAEKHIDLNESYGDGVEKVDATKLSDTNIIGNAKNNSIKAGGGNDEIDGGAGNDTLTGGKGDDIFIYSGGNDVITDYGTGIDLIQINIDEVEISAVETIGVNAVFTTNQGTLTVKNGNNKVITVIDQGGNIIYPKKEFPDGWKYDSAKSLLTASVASADNEIDLSESYGDGIETVDGSKISGGVKISGNDLENSIKGGAGNDVLDGGAGNDTLTSGTGDDVFIYTGGDDVFTDYTAGKDSIQIAIDNILETASEKIESVVSGSDVIFYIEDAGTLKVTKGKDKNIMLMDSNGIEITVGGEGGKFPDGWKHDATKKLLQASVASAENEIDLAETYGNGVEKADGSKISGGVSISGNDLNNSLKGGAGNDILDGGDGNDTLTSGTGDDVFVYSGGDDVFTDYTAGKDSIQVDINEIEIQTFETVGSDVMFYTDKGNFKITKGKDKKILLMDADGIEITLGGDDGKIPEGWKVDTTKKLLTASVASADNEIDLNKKYGKEIEKVDGSKISGGIEIVGNDLDNSIKGGRGSDIIHGDGGNDTVSLGGGTDIYIYTGGDDVIQDYAAGVDSIEIDTVNVEIVNVETVGNDIVYSTNVGTLKVVKGKGKEITLMDSNGIPINPEEETLKGWKISGTTATATLATVDNLDLSQVYGKNIEDVDASKATKAIKIIGNDKDNLIRGGKGADTITGGAGRDIFYYASGDGKDTITDYTAGQDIISISGSSSATFSKKNNDAIFKIGSGNITLKDAANVAITLVGADDMASIYSGGTVSTKAWNGFTDAPETVYITLPAETITVIETVTVGGDTVTVTVPGDTETVTVYETVTVGGDTVTVTVPGDSETVTVYGGGSKVTGTSGADTLYGTAGNDTFTGGNGADVFVYEGGNDYDLITDYKAGEDKISIGSNSVVNGMVIGSDVLFAIGDGVLKLKNAKDKKITIISGSTETEYVNGVVPSGGDTGTGGEDTNSGGDDTLAVNPNGVTVTLDADRNTNFSLSAYNSTVSVAAVNVDGSALRNAIWIYGDDGNNIIKAGLNTASIYAGAGDDVIYCGKGVDVIYYYSDEGNETIYNYQSGDRIIQRRSYQYDETTFKNISLSGNDVIINFTNGNKITLKDAKEQQILLQGYTYDRDPYYSANLYNYYNAFGNLTISGGTASLDTRYKGEFNVEHYAANISNIDASSVKNTTVDIYASDKANVIHAAQDGGWIYANDGNDTIYGTDKGSTSIRAGEGDDVIYCGNGHDCIYYYSNEGNETIYNYKSGDRIIQRRTDSYDETTFENISLSGNDVIINFTNGNKITLKDAKEQQISLQGYTYGRDPYYSADLYNYYNAFGNLTISGGTASLDTRYKGEFNVEHYAANIANVDASAVKNASVNVYADDNANVIHAAQDGGWIYAYDGNDTIYGTDKGSTSIRAGEGDDVIYCGNGHDCIYYYSNEGNETIYNYKSGDRIIQRRTDSYDETTFENISLSGNDVIINFTNGNKITLKDAKEQQISLQGYTYDRDPYYSANLYNYYNAFGNLTISGGTASLDTRYKGEFNVEHYAANIANVDASAVKNASVNVYADDNANVIHAAQDGGWIYANDGNDTIYGTDKGSTSIRAGEGDDVIYCGNGHDCIYYYSNEGNETIYNYKSGDRIIQRRTDSYDDTTFENISLSGNDVIINFTNGNKITLKDAKEQQISLQGYTYDRDPYYSADLYNYTITKDNISDYTGTSARVAEDFWFLEDDNDFVDSEIDSVIDSDNSVTNLNFNNKTENIFAQDDSFIAYHSEDDK